MAVRSSTSSSVTTTHCSINSRVNNGDDKQIDTVCGGGGGRRRRRASAASERRGETAVTPTNQRHARGPISGVAIATANSIDDDRQQATHSNTEKELRVRQSEQASQFLSTSYSVCAQNDVKPIHCSFTGPNSIS